MSDHAENVRNYYRRQGAEAERARILELLNGYKPNDWREDKTRLYILQLIKGEN